MGLLSQPGGKGGKEGGVVMAGFSEGLPESGKAAPWTEIGQGSLREWAGPEMSEQRRMEGS